MRTRAWTLTAAVVAATVAAGTLGVGASASEDVRASVDAARTVDAFEAKFGNDRRAQAKVELGRRLFFDPAVSRFGKTSCSSCHDPEMGFSDPRKLSRDEVGETPRHSQTMLDLGESTTGFHWDGEFGTLREIVTARLGSPEEIARDAAVRLNGHVTAAMERGEELDVEQLAAAVPRVLTASGPYGGSITPRATKFPGAISASGAPLVISTPAARTVSRRLEDGGLYDDGFREAFGERVIEGDRIVEALEAYMLTLRSTESPFDRYMAGDERALGPEAARGFELFAGKAGCASCHSIPGSGGGRAITDFEYHNTGISFVGMEERKQQIEDAIGVLERAKDDVQIGRRRNAPIAAKVAILADTGRTRVTATKAQRGAFKTANLRDVAKRGPYMHDGSLETLEAVVRYYDKGGTPNDHLDPKMKKLGLTDREVKDVVAFLEALSGDERPGLGAVGKERATNLRLRVLDLSGKPLKKHDMVVRPAGDRLRGTEAMPQPFDVTTDRFGYVTFPMPASTHVALHVAGHELDDSRLIPDWVDSHSVTATPLDRVAVIVKNDGETKLGSQLHVTPIAGAPAVPPGRTVSFQRERKLSGGRVLYSAPLKDVEHFVTCRSASLMTSTGKRGLGTFDFDASGGMTEMVDLRPPRVDEDVAKQRAEETGKLIATLTETGIPMADLLRPRQPFSRR